MSLMTSRSFLFVLSPFLVTLELVQQYLGRDLLLWCRGSFSLLLQLLALSFISRYLSFRINSSKFLGRLRWEHLGLQCIYLSPNIYHIGREQVPIDLHRLLGCLKLKSTLLYSRLYLLTKHFALVCVMRRCIVPFAVLDVL